MPGQMCLWVFKSKSKIQSKSKSKKPQTRSSYISDNLIIMVCILAFVRNFWFWLMFWLKDTI